MYFFCSWFYNEEVCAALDAVGIPNAPVNTIREVAEDPHFVQARNMFPAYEQPEIGDVRVTNLPLRFPEHGEVPLQAALSLGQHTQELLAELLEMNEADILRLRDEGVVTF